MTDSTGMFAIKLSDKLNSRLEISSVGYHLQTFPLKISDSSLLVNLPQIQLVPNSQQLGAITVTAKKPLVEDKGDRLVYNAEQDIANAGGTAADVLRKVPTLTVDLNGNVQMRGNGNLKILINGKPSAMMARNLADALKQMPANVIKAVEVITSPGAKYDAEGAAGVINIITKKGLKGVNGSMNATAGNMNQGLGGTFNVKTKKIGVSVSANSYRYRNISESSFGRTTLFEGAPINKLTQAGRQDNTGVGGYGEMSIDYDPDSTSHLNFAANVWGGSNPSDNNQFNILTNPNGDVLQSFVNNSKFNNPYGNGQLDLGYTKTLKKKDQEFSILTQFSRMPDNYFYRTTRSMQDVPFYKDKSTNYSRNKEYNFQSDYTHPFTIRSAKDTTEIRVEVGVKGIIRDIGSEFRVEQSLDGNSELIPDPTQSNDFSYTQKIYSGYMSFKFSNKKKWTINAGARMEHTEISGDFLTTSTQIKSQYNNLIPSINISKGFKKQTIKLAYNQRITRPLIWYLNPWINKSDPKNIQTGTPTLDPELTHGIELSHSLSNDKGFSLNTAAYMRVTNNALEFVARVDSAGISLSKPENIATRKAVGVNFNVSAKPTKDWTLNGGADLRYVYLKSAALRQQNDGIVWDLNTNSTYALPKNYSLESYAGLNSGWLSLQRTTKSLSYWYGLAGKKQFWEKKASLTLSLNNPFNRGVRQVASSKAPTFFTEEQYFYVSRSARLTFEWRFGSMTAGDGKKGRKIANDDGGR